MAKGKKGQTRDSRQRQANIPITFITCVYNEEKRIRSVLEHAVRWADEVIVVNKSSTDGTRAICEEFGDAVRVEDVPYSIKGGDDTVAQAGLATHDWIFFGPASEIPTRGLIEECKRVLRETGGQLDLVYVPRKYYSFGIHNPLSPWSFSYFPFLVNRKKAIISNTIHHNYTPSDPRNVHRIEYAEECCVYHWTHTTAKDFMATVTDYFQVEAEGCEDPRAKIQECMHNIAAWEERLRSGGEELFPHYCAWPLYWFGTALFTWERMTGRDIPQEYQEMREDLVRRDWRKPLT